MAQQVSSRGISQLKFNEARRIHRRSVFLRLQLAASCSRSFFARLWLSAAARMDVGSQLGNDELIHHLSFFQFTSFIDSRHGLTQLKILLVPGVPIEFCSR